MSLDALTPLRAERPVREVVDPAIGDWRGLGEVATAVLALRDRGARVEVERVSRSGLPVLRVELGPAAGPASVLVAGIHAMEWIGVEVALALLAGWPSDARLVAFPVLNPDGFRRAEEDLRAGRRRFVRANAAGVDLNRNWPTFWRPTTRIPRLLPFLGSAGEAPLSEPEVAGAVDAIRRIPRPDRRRAVSLHSFGNKLLVPYGGRWRRPEGHARLDAEVDAVNARVGGRYHRTTPSRWVPGVSFAYGMELDFLNDEGFEALLVECSRGGLSPLAPGSWLHPFRWFNPPDRERHVAELAAALTPFLRPRPAA